jgi:hypothetical protein
LFQHRIVTEPPVFTVGIGDVGITLISDEPDLGLHVPQATARFLVDNEGADVIVRARWGSLHDQVAGKVSFDSGGLWRLSRQKSNHVFRFTSPAFGTLPYKQACFSSDFTSGDIVLHREYFDPREPVNPLEYPLDELLVMNLLAGRRGVEVHACGVEDSGQGYLFVGQSGAGKTTMARLWQEAGRIDVLSDDRIILRCLEGRIWMYGTPWHGEGQFACATRTPLTHIFFLGRGETHEVVPVRPSEAVARLMATSFVPFYSASALEHVLALFEHVTEAIPCGELRFALDGRVAEFVREFTHGHRSSIPVVC